MKEILKIIYIAVCSAVCLYPIYRWVEDAVDDIRCSYRNPTILFILFCKAVLLLGFITLGYSLFLF